MIIDIAKGSFCAGIINYHEKKVGEGVAEMLYDSTQSTTKDGRIKGLMDVAELNPRMRKNKFVHFSFSYAKEDNPQVNDTLCLDITHRYMETMGYADTPYIVYRHYDKGHQHFHVVSTTCDYYGKKIAEYKDHERNMDLSRQLEQEFSLTPTVYTEKDRFKLQELNAQKYSISKAVSKGMQDEYTRSILESVCSFELLEDISKNNLTNDQVRNLILMTNSNTTTYQLTSLLAKQNLFNVPEKTKLIEALLKEKQLHSNIGSYHKALEAQGFYVRVLKAKGHVVYKYPEGKIHFKCTQLPLELQMRNLFSSREKAVYPEEKQRSYLRRNIRTCLSQSHTLLDFEKKLSMYGIIITYSENARGIYGVSFQSNNVSNPTIFKGSDLDKRLLTWNKISEQLGLTNDHLPKGPTASSRTVSKGIKPETLRPSGNVLQGLSGGLGNIVRQLEGRGGQTSDEAETERKRKGKQL